jgi:hypothetical protein
MRIGNMTSSPAHNRREYNPATQTHMRIEGNYILTTYTIIEGRSFFAQ